MQISFFIIIFFFFEDDGTYIWSLFGLLIWKMLSTEILTELLALIGLVFMPLFSSKCSLVFASKEKSNQINVQLNV